MSPGAPDNIGVGTPECAAQVLTDLYIHLRRNLARWASKTHQTPQPRMGYVGQHLVSAVTGFPGGRSGARGDDLKLPGGKVAEIKCCYRVDQLGQCQSCGAAVASIEKACPNEECESTKIVRKDDSKWLLTPKSEQELRELFIPACYYLVLFEFSDLAKADDINVMIFEVDPRTLGFSLCMIDYFFNIRAHSSSKAPFNLWPASPKFYMMRPQVIYWSVIKADDSVQTKRHPYKDRPALVPLGDLALYAGTDTFNESAIDALAAAKGIAFPRLGLPTAAARRRRKKLEILQERRQADKWDDAALADDFARAVYREKLSALKSWTKEFAPTL